MTHYLRDIEVADLLGVHIGTIRAWRCKRARGEVVGPPFRKFGRAVRYHAGDVDAWARAQIVDGDRRPI